MDARLVALSVGAIALLAGASTVAYLAYQPAPATTDLTLHSIFPVGFDRQTIALRAAGFDGQSYCAGAFKPGNFLNPKWTHEKVAFTDAPTSWDVAAANTIDQNYSIIGKLPPPTAVNEKTFPQVLTDLGLCRFQYAATIWETSAVVENHKPVEFRDRHGSPFLYAQTNVLLGGNGDGHNGTRFLLQGISNDAPNITVEYRLYEGKAKPQNLLYSNRTSPLLSTNDTFVTVFDIPDLEAATTNLVVILAIATDGVLDATPHSSTTLQTLVRLQTYDVQTVVGATSPILQPAKLHETSLNGGAVYHESTWAETAFVAPPSPTLVANLEATSNAAFLIQHAYEPQAKTHGKRHLPLMESRQLETITRIDVTESGRTTNIVSAYTWETSRREATFVVRLTETGARRQASPTVGSIAGATAALTQIGADGIEAVRVVAQGPSPEAAVRAASRLLDMEGQVQELKSTGRVAGTSDLWRGSQKYFLAAGALAAGWEMMEARESDDLREQVIHQFKATRIATETIVSLNPAGAVIVVGGHLLEYAAKRLIPQEAQDLAGRIVNTAIWGRPSNQNGAQAFAKVAPQIEAFASANNATILDLHQEARKNAPWASLPAAAFALLGASWLGSRRRRN